MIATLFIIFAFIRAFPWSRKRNRPALALTLMPENGGEDQQHEVQDTQKKDNNNRPRPSITLGNGDGMQLPRTRRKSSKFHEVTFSGSVGGGDSDETVEPSPGKRNSMSTTSNSSSAPYRYLSNSSRSRGSRGECHEYYQLHQQPSSSLSNGGSRSRSLGQRSDTMATEAEGEEFEVDPMDEDDEDETYDRETEEFYSNIQDAAGTGSSASRSKRSSLFSRSDSSATTTSSSGGGTFTGGGGGKRRSAASILSSSLCSDVMVSDRRSSTATEYSVRSGTAGNTQRRSSGRIRRYVSRMTIAGARRRTTGR